MKATSRRGSLALLPASLVYSLWISAWSSCAGPPTESEGTQSAAGASAAVDTATQDPLSARPADRVTEAIDSEKRHILTGHRHPLAQPAFDEGPAPDQAMAGMMLVLRPDEAQEQALAELVRAQHDPSSPLYHRWLTPESYGQRFGASPGDLARIAGWLQAQGMTVEQVAKSNRLVVFSGSVSAVERAFQTTMRAYRVAGELHHANATDPSIPSAFASVVSGVVSLHDFRARASYAHREFTEAENTTFLGGIQQSAIVPADLAIIYDAKPLYAAAIDGKGQSIAVIGRSNIDVGNVHTFRATYGLPTKDPVVIVADGNDPGIVCGGDEAEAYLDVEYAGALATQATVKFVVSGSTAASDGIFLASAYAVNHNVAPIVSLSYGLCERLLGSTGNAFFKGLWQQAATQGMTVLVASMDSGAAGCDAMEAAKAAGGLAVNGIGSTVFNTAVGGTQFDDVSNRSQYWAASNDAVTQASALGYIPETTWNESRGGGLYASGGGVSTLYDKPAWQFGLGVLPSGKRGVPDLAFAAAIQDPYRMIADNKPFGGGGTSAATPVFASMMALVLQKVGQSQGVINPTLYTLAYNQTYNGGAAVFHDITKGNNTVPGLTGYDAGPGYDLATGLGSVDAAQLVNHWSEGSSLPSFVLVAASPSASLITGGTGNAGFTVKASNGFTGAVSLSVSSLPTGVSALLSPKSLSGGGSTTATFTAASSATPGTYNVTVSASSGGTTKSVPLTLTVVAAPLLEVTTSVAYLDIAAGSNASAIVTTTPSGNFNSAVTLSVSGLPQGVTGTLSATSFKAPGSGSSVLSVKVATTAKGGSYLATLSAKGGTLTKIAYLQINVLPAPSFSLALNPSKLTVAQGASGNTVASTMRTTTFSATVSVKVSGMPTGVTASSGSIASPGAGIATLGISVSSSATPGNYNLTVTATGGGVTQTATLTLTVSGVTLTTATSTVSVKKGGTSTLGLTTASLGGFSASVAFSAEGLPAGVTATFTPATLAAPGAGSTTVKLSASSSAAVGTSTITLKATAGATVRSKTVSLTVRS